MADPIHQFEVSKIVDLPDIPIGGGRAIDMAFTNSTLAMTVAAGLIVLLMAVVTAKPAVVPGRVQSVGEMLFGIVDNLTHNLIGPEGRAFSPFVLTLFLFILAMNMLGLFLVFTATSQLAVTAALGIMTILLVIGVGFARHGLGFVKLFVPSGVPWPVLFLVVPIEVVAFLLRPVTLALRLFGNMMGGHVALKVFAGFVVSLGGLAAGGGLGWLGIPGAALALSGVVALTALEFLVAFLQAFVFAVLTTIYLNDVVNIGHH
ncbi:MAG: F0F1 ATP synthase subunit A [Proteobacteria bacterium]|nr:F0F1 ATP synthase subunit A [Pseudomonadota bacterium]MBW3617764.1 F0F1 ATP synthase subunit A [Pseudomonadota bacterium]